jgi:hypothetical protein
MNEAAPPPPEKPDGPVTNTAQLRAAIDSGRTGDKAAVGDPAAAPLGTDDEAAGASPGPWSVAQAHAAEHSSAARDARSHDLTENVAPKPGVSLGVMIGVVAALVLAAVLGWLVLGQGPS